jgi:hypothetical protein
MPPSAGHRPGAVAIGMVERDGPAKHWIMARAGAGPMDPAQDHAFAHPPHPPVRIAQWDSSYRSRATRPDFRNRFRFSAEPAGCSRLETAPFLFERRVPGQEFVRAVSTGPLLVMLSSA